MHSSIVPTAPAAAADSPIAPEPSLTEKTASLEPAEQLLNLAADFTRFNDAHQRHALNGPAPATLLNAQTESAQHLARSALAIVDTLNAQPMYHSPAIHAVYARVRQLAISHPTQPTISSTPSTSSTTPAGGCPLSWATASWRS
ncbi:hypothetical protein ACTPOK_09885 [Streptomyces inhibens]|uniref:hypothetical protein n=1 Tax=Streptomyces inhibens TaxID=2293571 RepID=UPI00402A8819